jgi:hypothetical protein
MIEGSGSVALTMDPDPGGPKTYGYYGSGSATLVTHVLQHFHIMETTQSSQSRSNQQIVQKTKVDSVTYWSVSYCNFDRIARLVHFNLLNKVWKKWDKNIVIFIKIYIFKIKYPGQNFLWNKFDMTIFFFLLSIRNVHISRLNIYWLLYSIHS